ncbi:MAG: thioesterase family protein [Gordonia sp. (in: high G+C Gram-positive bacteria)]
MGGTLSGLLELTRIEDGHDAAGLPRVSYGAVIDPTFTIGPKVHGGSMQMLVAHAATRAVADLARPSAAGTRSADTSAAGAPTGADLIPVAIASDYLAAPDPAEVTLHVTVAKRGRTVSLLRVELVQNGRTMVSSSVTLARPDTGAGRYSGTTVFDGVPATPPADGITLESSAMAQINHLGPALDLVLDADTFPMLRGETGEPLVRAWTRPKVGEPTTGFAVLVCDLSPPVVMNLGLFGWAPTVQLTTYVRREPAPGWLRFAASSTEVGPGMFEEDHVVVDSTGTVVAQSRQLALIPQRS